MNIISWSGGHDSTAMLHHLIHQKNFGDFQAVFLDSTINMPETLDYIKQIVKDFGIQNQFVWLTPEQSFYDRLLKYNFWPSIRALWCRKYLKLDPMQKYYQSISEEITEYIGVAQADSGIRKKLYRDVDETKKWGKKTVHRIFPILKWSDEFKAAYFRQNRIPLNPVYETVGLSGCYFCPYYHPPEYRKIKQFHPELFDMLLWCEYKTGKRALPDFWLRDIDDPNCGRKGYVR